MEDYEQEDYEDYDGEAAEYSPKSEFSKPKIVYEAFQKCINARGDEMRAGYYNVKVTAEGIPTKTWVKDSRQIFIGTVIALRGLLSPELGLNSDYGKKVTDAESELKKIFDKYVYEEKSQVVENNRLVWKSTGRRYIPEIDETVVVQNVNQPGRAVELRGKWNSFSNAYWGESVKIYDKIFCYLNDLINDLNYFKQQISY